MDAKRPMAPRDVYRAYLHGELTPDQAERAVQTWYAVVQMPDPPRPKD